MLHRARFFTLLLFPVIRTTASFILAINWKFRPQFAAGQMMRVLPVRIAVKSIAHRYIFAGALASRQSNFCSDKIFR
jgi:hypothetical protein